MMPGHYGGRERRRHPRSRIPFYVTVTGTDADGHDLDDAGILHNISQGGLYIRIPHCMEQGAGIMCLIRFSEAATGGPQIPVRGRVVRSEVRTLGVCDLAVEFTRPLLEDFG
jgi:hypothetical protein